MVRYHLMWNDCNPSRNLISLFENLIHRQLSFGLHGFLGQNQIMNWTSLKSYQDIKHLRIELKSYQEVDLFEINLSFVTNSNQNHVDTSVPRYVSFVWLCNLNNIYQNIVKYYCLHHHSFHHYSSFLLKQYFLHC